MKNGLIIYNNYWSSNSLDYCVNSIINSSSNYNIDIMPMSGRDLSLNIDSLQNVDFIIMRDKFPNIAKAAEFKGIRVFNSSEAIRICDDKALMSITLKANNIPMPNTIISPETYGKELGAEFLSEIMKLIKFPIIVKKIKSSHGIGVFMARNEEELMKFESYKDYLIFEQFIPVPFGKDIRVFVIGGRIAGAIERSGVNGEFRSNIELGGYGKTVKIDNVIEKLAISAASAVGADYSGVDIINAKQPLVLEVNSSPGFQSMDEINNINISDKLLAYIMETIK